jgi:hypothetical protein
MQEGHQDTMSLQTQGKAQHSQQQTSVLQNIHTGSYLVFDLTPSDPLDPEQMVHEPSQLCPGIHTS